MLVWAERWVVGGLLAAALPVLAGCGPGPASAVEPVRHDREPITRRFPGFGDFQAVTWQSEVLGTGGSRVPGPTDVRLTGVVRLAPAEAEELRSEFTWRVSDAEPSVLSGVAPHVPDEATWRVSEAFTRSVTDGHYRAAFFVDFAHSVVVFDAVNPDPT